MEKDAKYVLGEWRKTNSVVPFLAIVLLVVGCWVPGVWTFNWGFAACGLWHVWWGSRCEKKLGTATTVAGPITGGWDSWAEAKANADSWLEDYVEGSRSQTATLPVLDPEGWRCPKCGQGSPEVKHRACDVGYTMSTVFDSTPYVVSVSVGSNKFEHLEARCRCGYTMQHRPLDFKHEAKADETTHSEIDFATLEGQQ